MSALGRRIYSLLMELGQPLLRRKLARRGRQEAGYLEAVEERFGVYTQPAEQSSELVWLHAVSLGETRTAALLLKALRAQHPGLRILLTHGTATGRAEGRGLLRAGDVQVWQPWDSAAAVAGFFTHFQPRLGLLMETEVWPNTVAAAQARAIPLLLVNGRLSEKSLTRRCAWRRCRARPTARWRRCTRRPRATRSAFAALARRWPVSLATSNLTPRRTPANWRQALGPVSGAGTQPVLMFASSREREEEPFL